MGSTHRGLPRTPAFPHPDQVNAVAFSPDNRIVLTGCNDRFARLWDAAGGKLLWPPLHHHNAVMAVAFTGDGQTLWTGGWDHVIRRWSVPKPIKGDPKQITRWIQVLTWMEMDDLGNAHELDAETWNDRRRQLAEVGVPPAN